VEGVRSLAEQSPVTSQGNIFLSGSLQDFVLQDHDADASRTDVFLGSSVNDVVFRPVNLLAAEVA